MAKKDQEAQGSGLGAVLLVAIGLAVLVGLYAFARTLREDSDEAKELPLASIMIEVNAFDANTRGQIIQLENGLRATGVFGNPFGPADVKLLVPGDKPGDLPAAKSFGDLTDQDWAKAWPYVARTDYLVPRLFRLDGSACVIRLDAKGGAHEFAPDAASKLADAVAPFKDKFKSLRVYSKELGVGSPQDRDALNASFGVQLAWVLVTENKSPGETQPPSVWRTAAGIAKLGAVKPSLKNSHILSVTTAASLVRYFWTVCLQTEKQADLPSKDEEVAKALDFAKSSGIHPLMTADGREAIVDTTTDTEGQENAEIVWFLASNLQNSLGVEVRSNYKPRIVHKLKGEMTPDTPR